LNTFGNPFSLWTKVAFTMTEMMMASANVIGQRTTRMAAAGANPTAADHRENLLMSQEKIEAVSESAQEIWARMVKLNQQFVTIAFKDSLAGVTAMMSLGTRRGAMNAMAEPAKLIENTVKNSAVAASRISGATAQIAQQALKPISSRATKNAKRLKKRKR
jgi:hypothetical protein